MIDRGTVVIVLSAALAGSAISWYIQDMRYTLQIKASQLAAAQAELQAVAIANEASANYESAKVVIETKAVAARKAVVKYVDRPIYKNVCIDQDGIDTLNSLIDQ